MQLVFVKIKITEHGGVVREAYCSAVFGSLSMFLNISDCTSQAEVLPKHFISIKRLDASPLILRPFGN